MVDEDLVTGSPRMIWIRAGNKSVVVDLFCCCCSLLFQLLFGNLICTIMNIFQVNSAVSLEHVESEVSSASTQLHGDEASPCKDTLSNVFPDTASSYAEQSISISSIEIADIADCIKGTVNDSVKYYLIQNRQPHSSFKFPAKQYKDKRSTTGYRNRHCNREWLKMFPFVSYSEKVDGLFCLPCVLFPDTSHRRPNKLISEPYQNWKDAVEDLRQHSACDYHSCSMAKLNAFTCSHTNPSSRVDVAIADANSDQVLRNRQVLTSIIKCLELCGRQGIALRPHRDDTSSLSKGNFQALLQLRIDAGDEILQNHVTTCARNAMYTSSVSQNDLLLCIKEYLQSQIVQELKAQSVGPYFGIQCDEVTDCSNWEQLGIVVRYVRNFKPVERLLQFVACEKITGEELCGHIVKALEEAGLDIQMCRSMTMDGAGNMAGKQMGCAARLTCLSPKAVYHYCSSHDLNLALCKSCQVKEVHLMLDSLTQLGIFFKYSPKRSRCLEEAIDKANEGKSREEQTKKSKIGMFCQTRWVEKQNILVNFDDMFEPIIGCFETIASAPSWDAKVSTEAYGLLKKVTDHTFVVCFQVVLHIFGYIKGLSIKLQGSELDILHGYEMINQVKSVLKDARSDEEWEHVFEKATKMTEKADCAPIEIPRRCNRMTQRSNVPAETASEYFKRCVYFPFLDNLIQQFEGRFGSLSQQAVRGINLIPANSASIDPDTVSALIDYYSDDLPSPATFHQEVKLWQRMWQSKIAEDRPTTLSETLSDSSACPLVYPNITKILHLLLITSVTSCGVERANSSLRFVKSSLRSTMGEDRFNALMLLYVHKNIALDIDTIVAKASEENVVAEHPWR